MAGTTPNFGFPYPQATDLVTNGASDMQALAEAVDSDLASINGRLGTVEADTFPTVRGSGAAAFNASGYVDIAHNLGVKPTAVQVQTASHFGDTWSVTVDMASTDTNSFRVYGRNVAGAITSQTRTIVWTLTA